MKEVPVEHAFEFCPRCAAANAHIGSVPYRCVQCGYTNFFGPVAAVAAIVVDQENRLLLVRRAKDPQKGFWGLPGGFVDRFESAEDAIVREVLEETNLQVSETHFLLTHPNRYNYQGTVTPVIDLFFRCQIEPGPITLVDGELDDYQWTHPSANQLRDMAFASNRIAVEHWMHLNHQDR
ncbi:MAG: NUDIX domain-containing protein [Pirellulales bacterium]|nr:NUDIX domain-containing protein [Pirellulales bacterium]